MEKFMQCECCGAELQPPVDGVTVECEYCGRKIVWKEPKSESLILALNRANNFRRANRFSDAIMEYRLITERNPQDAEAWWGLTVSTYGIEYVKDPRGGYVPTCHRTVREEIFTNGDYKKAITNAAESQRAEYENEAKEIDRLQKEILRLVDEGEDYDVFVSFKSKDLQGRMTKDASVARNIYDELTNRGIKTFFSDVTLSNKLFTDYEPIIYRALTSCKYFILVATSEKNLNSEWVKNEWSRFEERMEKEKLSGVACAVFEGGEVKELPPFLRAQGVDLRQYPAGGYEKVIADNIERKLGKKKKSKEEEEILRQIEEQKKAQRELEERLKGIQKTGVGDSVPAANATVTSLLMRAGQELEAQNWWEAISYYKKVLDVDPVNGKAWWGLYVSDFWGSDTIKEKSRAEKLKEDLTYREAQESTWTGESIFFQEISKCELNRAYQNRSSGYRLDFYYQEKACCSWVYEDFLKSMQEPIFQNVCKYADEEVKRRVMADLEKLQAFYRGDKETKDTGVVHYEQEIQDLNSQKTEAEAQIQFQRIRKRNYIGIRKKALGIACTIAVIVGLILSLIVYLTGTNEVRAALVYISLAIVGGLTLITSLIVKFVLGLKNITIEKVDKDIATAEESAKKLEEELEEASRGLEVMKSKLGKTNQEIKRIAEILNKVAN